MTDNSKSPQIRFKGFSENISFIKLKDVVLLNTYGPRFNANDYDINGNVKTIRGTDISLNGNILYNQVPIAKLDINFIKSHILEDGNLVMITTADCGLTGIFEKQKNNYICSAYAVKIALNKKSAFPNYFKYFFQTSLAKNEVNKYLRTATISNLPASDILKITLMLPSIQEQEKIASFLNLIYKLIEQKEKKQQKLKQFKKAMLDKMFPKNGANTPEVRFKGFSGEWDNEKLEELADFSKGQGYSKSDLVDFGTSIVLYGRLYTKYQTVISKVDTFVLKNNNSIFSKGNEVIVPSSGETAEDIARASAITVKGTILGGDLNIIYPRNKINNVFLALNISNGKTQKDLSNRAQGKSVVHLRNNDLKEVNLSYPDKTEQIKIANYFQKLDQLIDLQLQELEKLKNIKKASLDKMFV